MISYPPPPRPGRSSIQWVVVNKEKNTLTAESEEAAKPPKSDIPRGVIAEWTVTILLLLFGTTTLVQAFVIPTGSMEDTLLVGDHLLVRVRAREEPASYVVAKG